MDMANHEILEPNITLNSDVPRLPRVCRASPRQSWQGSGVPDFHCNCQLTVIALTRVLVDTARALASIPQYTSRSHAVPHLHALLENLLGQTSKPLQISASHLDVMAPCLGFSAAHGALVSSPR